MMFVIVCCGHLLLLLAVVMVLPTISIGTSSLPKRCRQVDPDDVEIRRSKFHFVDLAGSERAKRTGASGQRFKEVTACSMDAHMGRW